MQSLLAFARAGRRTAVVRARAVAPLRLLTPNNHGSAAWAYTTSLGGGLVGGDEVALRIEVGAGARALVSSMGDTRVYRSPRTSSSLLEAEVAEGGFLALLPDPTAPFAGARFEQRTRVRLGEGASLAFADLLTAGRAARDGPWALGRFHASTEIACEGRILVREAMLLDPLHGALADRLGGAGCLGTLWLVGPALAALAGAARASIDAAPPATSTDAAPLAAAIGSASAEAAPVLQSCSALEGGLVVRLAARTAQAALAAVRAHLAGLPALLGDDPFARRA